MSRSSFGALRIRAALVASLAGVAGGASAQNAVIGGRVTGGTDQPLGGAVVLIRELNLSVATSASGTYTLTVPADRARGQLVTLMVRYIGYRPAIRRMTLARGPHAEDFELVSDPLQLEEVVVTGTAEATASNELSFSVGTVPAVDLQVPALDPLSALGGKVAGVHVVTPGGQPGTGSAVRLRSATSLTPGASQQPLLIVDGVITQGTLADLNAEDIERMEVVKGAAASSLYGSNAAAGVIQVFTKRGAANADGVTTVTARNEYGQLRLGRRMPLNHSHYWQLDAGGNYLLDADGNKQIQASHYADQPYPATVAGCPDCGPWRDQQDDILGNGAFYTNYVAVGRRQGGSNMQASFENQSNAGIISFPGTNLGYVRRNARMNLDQVLSDRLDISVGGFYNESHGRELADGVGSAFFDVLFMPPDVDLRALNADSTPYKVNVGLDGAIPSSQTSNPLYTATHQSRERDRTRVQGNGRLRWRPLDWLSFEGQFGYDRSQENFRNYVPKGTLLSTGAIGLGSLNISNTSNRSYNAGASASLQRTFGELQGRLKLAGTVEDQQVSSDNAGGSNFASADVPDLSNLGDQATKTIGSNIVIARARNIFAVAGLTYRSRYIVDALIRRDGSSLFGPGARYATYYRMSGAYRLSQDVRIPGVQELRLRASRGTAGLRPPFAAQYETFTTAGGQITPGVLGNRLLKPAHSTEDELGFNLECLNRFSVEYSYSHKVTRDQVLPVPLSSVAGFTSQWRNAGALDGRTHEFALGAVLADNRDVKWNLNDTFDRTRMRVTQLSVPPFTSGSGDQSNDVFLIKQGEVYGSMWGYRFAHSRQDLADNPANWSSGTYGLGTMTLDTTLYTRNEDGFMILTSTHGTVNERALKYVDRTNSAYYQIGDANPDFTMSFSTSLSYRGFTVYALLDWVKGGNIYNLPRQWLSRAEYRAAEVDQAGKPASEKKAFDYYNAIMDGVNFNEFYVEPGSYSRLRELSVNYTFSPTTVQSIGLGHLVRSLRIGLVGRNLFTWTHYSGLDPETHNAVGSAGDATTFRFDDFAYPNFRTFSAMVDIGF
jgi:TonB-linked SusC/RagA family outer membrane protein